MNCKLRSTPFITPKIPILHSSSNSLSLPQRRPSSPNRNRRSSSSSSSVSSISSKNNTIKMSLSGGNPANEGQQPKKVIVKNEQGESLVGLLHDTGSNDIVVLCHGFRSKKEQTSMVNLAVGLEKEGISAFRFDFSGNGESEGSFTYGGYWKEAEDLRSVVVHFSQQKRFVSVIIGHSKGAGVVLLYASKYHDIPAVVNLSGRYDLNKGIAERLGADYMEKIEREGFIDVKTTVTTAGTLMFRVTKEALMDRLNTDMHEASLRIDKDCRVLTVHGSEDEIIPVEDAHEFSKIISNHKLHIIEGADHCYNKHQPELAAVVLAFVKETLVGEKASG